MRIESVFMTPEWASSLLEKNCVNRPLSGSVVRNYAKSLKTGAWRLTHQGIALSTNGELIDGQHRLHAIVLTGTGAEILLFSDCDPATFTVLDTGYKRTAGHALSLGGVASPNEVAAVCRLAMAYERVPHKIWASSLTTYTNDDIFTWHEKYAESIGVAVKTAISCRNKFPLIKRAPLATALFLAIQGGYEMPILSHFLDQLCDGDGLQKDSPVFSFRRALINGAPDVLAKANTSKTNQAWLASFIHVFNSWAMRRPSKLFRVPAFPPMPQVVALSQYETAFTH